MPILKSLSSVNKLVFNYCRFGSEFYTEALLELPCLANSLTVLKIYEQYGPVTQAALDPSFLPKFKHLRYFGTNLICKTRIEPTIQLIVQCPFTVSFRFETGLIDRHSVVIKKIRENQFDLTILERNYRDAQDGEKRHQLGPVNQFELKHKLDTDPTCLRLLRQRLEVPGDQFFPNRFNILPSPPPEVDPFAGSGLTLLDRIRTISSPKTGPATQPRNESPPVNGRKRTRKMQEPRVKTKEAARSDKVRTWPGERSPGWPAQSTISPGSIATPSATPRLSHPMFPSTLESTLVTNLNIALSPQQMLRPNPANQYYTHMPNTQSGTMLPQQSAGPYGLQAGQAGHFHPLLNPPPTCPSSQASQFSQETPKTLDSSFWPTQIGQQTGLQTQTDSAIGQQAFNAPFAQEGKRTLDRQTSRATFSATPDLLAEWREQNFSAVQSSLRQQSAESTSQLWSQPQQPVVSTGGQNLSLSNQSFPAIHQSTIPTGPLSREAIGATFQSMLATRPLFTSLFDQSNQGSPAPPFSVAQSISRPPPFHNSWAFPKIPTTMTMIRPQGLQSFAQQPARGQPTGQDFGAPPSQTEDRK